MEAYKIEHLNKSYADKEIFNDLNLSISEHERIVTAKYITAQEQDPGSRREV